MTLNRKWLTSDFQAVIVGGDLTTSGSFSVTGTITGTQIEVNNVIASFLETTSGNFVTLTGETIQAQTLTAANLQFSGNQTISGSFTVLENLFVSGDALINSITVGLGAGSVSTNTAVGNNALLANTIGVSNTAVGYQALYSNTEGDNNTANGNQAGRYKQDGTDATNFTNCAYLGHNTRASANNQVQLGDSSTTTYAYGAVQDRSDARDKTDIRDTLLGLDFIKSLRPVDFRWDMRDDYFDKEEYQEDELCTREVPNPAYEPGSDELEFIDEEYTETVTKERFVTVPKDGSRARTRFHHGLIAQEVKAAADAQGVDFAGYQDHNLAGGTDVLSIGYTEIIAPLIKAVQELSAKNAELKARLDTANL